MKKLLSLLMSLSIFIFLFSFVQQSNISYNSEISPFIATTQAAVRNIGRDVCEDNPFEDGCEDWEPPVFPVNGVCQSYPWNYIIQPAQNSNNWCSPWTYLDITDNDNEWRWSCGWANWWTTVTCSAAKNTNNCTVWSESSYQTQQRTTCDSMSNSLPFCSDIAGTEGTSGSCITRLEDSRVTIPLSPVRYQDTWVSTRMQSVIGRWSKTTAQWRAGHKKLCENAWYTVTPQTLDICKSDENSTGGWDYYKYHSSSWRCYHNGQKEDKDWSDKDKAWLCQRTITEETVNQCESYKVDYNCASTTFCTANEVENGSTRACPSGYTWEETSTRTCNGDGTTWWDYVWDNSACTEIVANTCTANEIENGSTRACPSGYTWEETSTRTCNGDGTAWWPYVWDNSACMANVCEPNEIGNGTQSCPAGYTWDETRERSCNSNWTAWWSWSAWNTSGCISIGSCTANQVATESVACGTGYVWDQTRTNRCNSTWTDWLGWTTYDRSNCTAVVCSANEVANGTQSCPAGYTWNETRERTCNDIWTAWWSWSTWDNWGCIANVCTANEVATDSVACGTGFKWNQTRTNTCNSDGSAWLGWTAYDRSACEDAIRPTWTVRYDAAWPAWTNEDVVVTITCQDNENKCDMVTPFQWPPVSPWTISGLDAIQSFSSNTAGSIVFSDEAENLSVINYAIDYIDKSMPWAPTISATDGRSSDVWSQTSTWLNANIENSTQPANSSLRFNQYCKVDASNNCTMINMSGTTIPWVTSLSDGIHTYRVRTCTQAWNCGAESNPFIIKIDTIDPEIEDLINFVPSVGANLLANRDQNFQIEGVARSWSPISQILWSFEDWNSVDSQSWTWLNSLNDLDDVSDPANRRTLNVNLSTENVDRDNVAWAREYSMRIVRICDEAINCIEDLNGLTFFDYNVYANAANLDINPSQVTSTDLTSWEIADGSVKNINIELRDVYGNMIIPVSAINRTVGFTVNADNNLFLQQHTMPQSGWTAVFRWDDDAPWSTNWSNTIFTNMSPIANTYAIPFRVYTPTAQFSYGHPDASFSVTGVNVNISWDLLSTPTNSTIVNNSNAIDFEFNPLYTTSFGWALVTNWFIEWASQTSNISVTKLNPLINTNLRDIYMEYTWDTDQLNLNVSYGPNTISDADAIGSLITNFQPNLSYPFDTLLTQYGGAIGNISNISLSSHIDYRLDNKQIRYNGDVIGKNNYFDATSQENAIQTGIKVTWITSSQGATNLTNDQFTDDLSILGKITKSTSRRDIQSKVFGVIKNITSVNGWRDITRLDGANWSNNLDGTKLLNNSVLYFGDLSWANVELWDETNETINGKKTIVIEWWNLYIKNNLEYASDNDILWIVVLKDEDGNGWNLYVDPRVTDIDATIYVDKSVISYASGAELDGNTQASTLANQLYIYGSLFSENTIWGSRAASVICPYYVPESTCGSISAQKYDLNYLRRYFVNPDGVASWNASSEWSTIGAYPVVIKYNSKIQSSPPPLFD